MWPNLINMLIANPKRFESKVFVVVVVHYITNVPKHKRNVRLSDHVFYMFQRSEDVTRK